MAEAAPPQPIRRPGIIYHLGRALLRPALWLLYRPIVTGREHIPATGPVLLASNHLSAWDTVLIPVAASRPVQFLTKAAYFTGSGPAGAVRRWFFTSIGGVPVTRTAGHDAQAALHAGSRILRAGSVFAVFPEGSRSRDGRLYRGRSGAAWIALETGATVVPIGLIGTELIGTPRMRPFGWLRGRAGARPRRPQLRFGAPLELGDLAGRPAGGARREATARIMAAIAALSGQERAEGLNPGSRD